MSNRKVTKLQLKFGRNVKARRIELGLTQLKLAELADIDDAYMSDIETGKRNVSLDVICRISKALDITPCLLIPSE